MFDLGLSLIQLRLTKFNNWAEPERVTCLCEIQGLVGLVQELLRDREPLKRGIRPGRLNLTNNLALHISEVLIFGLCLRLRFAF